MTSKIKLLIEVGAYKYYFNSNMYELKGLKGNFSSYREFLVGLITSTTNRGNMKYEIEIPKFLISQIPMHIFEKIGH